MQISSEADPSGFQGVAALLGWVGLLFAGAFVKRAGQPAAALVITLAGATLLAVLSGRTVRRKLREGADRDFDMDLSLNMAVLLLTAILAFASCLSFFNR